MGVCRVLRGGTSIYIMRHELIEVRASMSEVLRAVYAILESRGDSCRILAVRPNSVLLRSHVQGLGESDASDEFLWVSSVYSGANES